MRVICWLMVLAFGLFAASPIVADDSLTEAEAIAKIKQLGGTIDDAGPVAASIKRIPVPLAVIPFWSIVIPLALISGYLLLSKPRSVTPRG